MTIKEQFCPKCGGPTEGGLCPVCKVGATEWLKCTSRVEAVSCPSCGSLKHGNTWTDVDRDPEEIAAELAMSALDIHEDVRDIQLRIECRDPTPNRTRCTVHVTGTLYGIGVEETCEIEIAWKREQCDRCNRFSGGYYEGILQLRAADRKPDRFELERASEIASRIEEELQTSGERLSFVSRIDETKDGLDIIVSSNHIGDLISREIRRDLGGRITTHPKLVGERDGKKLYRITFSIRLPCYQKGDIIRAGTTYYEIREMEAHTMKVFNLRSGAVQVLQEDCGSRPVGNVRDADQALVAYMDGNLAGILDPDTYRTEECPVPPWLHISEGTYIRVLKDHEYDHIILVG